MSRSGYIDDGDCDSTEDFLRMCGWNANVRRCLGGRTGQAFMWELYQALEALPERRLIQGALEDHGAYCALGAVARARGEEIPAELRASETQEEEDDYELQDRYRTAQVCISRPALGRRQPLLPTHLLAVESESDVTL